MVDTDLLSNSRLAIIGLGLMGGSLALALRGKCAVLLGVDPDPAALELASQWNLVDELSAQPADLVPQADLVVLAAPVRAILQLLGGLPAWHPGRAVVLDLGSTKMQIVEAMQSLPERFDPLGGHPMCGKEKSSLANAEAGLFRGAPFAFTPLARTSPRARRLALQIAQAAGALPLWLDPQTHDRWVAASSHLPYLLANTLAAVTPPDASPLVGSGFRSTARLAPSSLNMMMDILATNQPNILSSLRLFRQRLGEIEERLASGDEAGLRQALEQGAESYQDLVKPVKPSEEPANRLESKITHP